MIVETVVIFKHVSQKLGVFNLWRESGNSNTSQQRADGHLSLLRASKESSLLLMLRLSGVTYLCPDMVKHLKGTAVCTIEDLGHLEGKTRRNVNLQSRWVM